MYANCPRNDSMWVFIIDTKKYAGNFERTLCAWLTGAIGECEVGISHSKMFEEEVGDSVSFDNVKVVPDDHGCYRPVSIYTTPGWSNNGHGVNTKLKDGEKMNYPSYNSVGIFFHDEPTKEQIDLMIDRSKTFPSLDKFFKFDVSYITGYRLINIVTTVEENVKQSFPV